MPNLRVVGCRGRLVRPCLPNYRRTRRRRNDDATLAADASGVARSSAVVRSKIPMTGSGDSRAAVRLGSTQPFHRRPHSRRERQTDQVNHVCGMGAVRTDATGPVCRWSGSRDTATNQVYSSNPEAHAGTLHRDGRPACRRAVDHIGLACPREAYNKKSRPFVLEGPGHCKLNSADPLHQTPRHGIGAGAAACGRQRVRRSERVAGYYLIFVW